jgi:hypothetical protein
MSQIAALTVAVFALLATGSMAQSTAGRSYVVLHLTLPSGETPQLKITEGETGSVELPKVGKFGFVPTVRAGTGTIIVAVFDLSRTPGERIDRLELISGGDSVQSATTPTFGVRVDLVITK